MSEYQKRMRDLVAQLRAENIRLSLVLQKLQKGMPPAGNRRVVEALRQGLEAARKETPSR